MGDTLFLLLLAHFFFFYTFTSRHYTLHVQFRTILSFSITD